MNVENWFICLIIASLVMVLALIARADQGSWFAPGAFFSLVWSFYLLFPLLVAADYEVWPGAVLGIFIATASVYAGSMFGLGGIRTAPRIGYLDDQKSSALQLLASQKGERMVLLPGLRFLTIACSALGCLAVLTIVRSADYSVGNLLSVESLAVVASRLSVARYQEGYSPPLMAQFLTMGMYAGALFGGVLFTQSRSKLTSLLALLPFLPALVFMLVFTTRASVLFQMILWVSAYISGRIFLQGWRCVLFARRFLLLVLILVPVLFGFLTLALMARYGEDWDAFQSLLWPRLRGDLAGYLAGFSQWFKSVWQVDFVPTYGAFIFAGVFEVFGLQERVLGIYEELVDLSSEESVVATNIYTAFRGLIQDYSLPGALVLLFIVGYLASIAYRQVASGSFLHLPLLSSFYTFVLSSHVGSFTAYNTLLGAYGLFLGYAVIIRLAVPRARFLLSSMPSSNIVTLHR